MTSVAEAVLLALAALYAPLLLWCGWKLVQLMVLVPYDWTVQKSMHLLIGVSCGVRVAFFAAVPTVADKFFYVQMTGDGAPTWMYILDELPTLFELLVVGMLIHMWAQSVSMAAMRRDVYLRCHFRILVAAFATVLLLQISLWIAYDLTDAGSEALAVAEGAIYSTAFFAAATAVGWFGRQAAAVGASVPSAGLQTRLKFQRRIRLQAMVCTVAMLFRALASLGAAIGAATQLDRRVSETSPLGLSITFIVFSLFELVPLAIILRQNRYAAGLKGFIASPLGFVATAAANWCARMRARRAAARGVIAAGSLRPGEGSTLLAGPSQPGSAGSSSRSLPISVAVGHGNGSGGASSAAVALPGGAAISMPPMAAGPLRGADAHSSPRSRTPSPRAAAAVVVVSTPPRAAAAATALDPDGDDGVHVPLLG